MNEESIFAEVKSFIDKYGNNENHLASVDYSDHLATIALGAEIDIPDNFGMYFKIAFALGYEARRESESDKPLDKDIWTWD